MIVNPISYPGNKNKLVKQIIPLLPKTSYFVDVFCGSGVVSVNSLSDYLICNDNCKEALQVLEYFYKKPFDEIINEIEKIIYEYGLTYSRKHEKGYYVEYKHEGLSRYNKEPYLRLKDDYNKDRSIDKLVVLLIYGFNHYIRFNKNNEFNVPVGKVDFSNSIYKNMKIFVDEIKSKNITIINYDFRNEDLYKYTDAIYYFDPPYLITTAPYNSNWNEKDEIDLLQILDSLNDKGLKFALSNVTLSNGKKNELLIEWSKKYNTTIMKRQYRNANYQKVNVTDSIEVLIKNF